MNGCELARLVLEETHTAFTDADDAMYLDKSPEYWAGWALAFYQWYSSLSFMDILTAVPLSGIISMYPVYHEMDVTQFADHMDALMKAAAPTPTTFRAPIVSGRVDLKLPLRPSSMLLLCGVIHR